MRVRSADYLSVMLKHCPLVRDVIVARTAPPGPRQAMKGVLPRPPDGNQADSPFGIVAA